MPEGGHGEDGEAARHASLLASYVPCAGGAPGAVRPGVCVGVARRAGAHIAGATHHTWRGTDRRLMFER